MFLEVDIQFQDVFYEANEGSSPLQVCVVRTGEIASSISVTLTSTNITATRKSSIVSYGAIDNIFNALLTAGDDYSSINEVLVISPTQDPVQCIEVTIVDDDIVESSEAFSISLTTNQPGVNFESDETTVTIMDNDGGL